MRQYKLHTINEMITLAKAKGGECLSQEYINNHSHLNWRCKYNHKWSATPMNIVRGQWCKICAYNNKGKYRKS